MADPKKPAHSSGYLAEDVAQVRAVCLTVAAVLGSYREDLCVVGGLVPALLIDARRESSEGEEIHPGTNDFDLGLSLGLLDDQRYQAISAALRREGFEPDRNDAGNPALQRWRRGELRVTVDFLIPPSPGDQSTPQRIHKLERDFGALVTPGLELAFDETVDVVLTGETLSGERLTRTIPVCGPAAFVVLKALAFHDRVSSKDAYDLTYVIRHTPGKGPAIAQRLAAHAKRHPEIVQRALALLASDFESPDHIGPLRAVAFGMIGAADNDDALADTHGDVADLLDASRDLGLIN